MIRHGAAAVIGDAVSPRALPQEPEHHAQRDSDDGATQLVIPGKQVPQPMRQTQHPLSNRHVGEHVIDQIRRTLGHAATAAPRAEAAALARKGHEAVQSARGAPEAGEAAGQTATPKEVAELLLDKSREPFPVTNRCRVRAKRLEMVPHDLLKDARRGIARLVCARRLRHAQSSGAPRANKRNPSIRRECIDHHGDIEILPTGVAFDARSARDRAHVGHLFAGHARLPACEAGATAVTHRAPS